MLMKTGRMEDFSSLILTFSLFFLITKFFVDWARRKPPPGPWGFPVIGHLAFLGSNPVIQFQKWQREYGDVFQIRMGKWPAVVLSGSAIKQALLSKGDEFSGRPDFLSFQKIGDQKSITSSDFSPRYVAQKKLATSILRMFTSTRKDNPINDIIQEEANTLIHEFLEHGSSEFDPMGITRLSAANVIYQVCYGRGLSGREDKDFLTVVKNADNFTEFFRTGNAVDVLPWLRFLLRKPYRFFISALDASDGFRNRKIAEHMSTFDGSDIRDCADGVISAAKDITPELKSNGVDEHSIHVILGDFIGAGFDTTAAAVNWAIYYAARYPDIQNEVRDEIQREVGNRIISVHDKENVPFTEAFISETLRMGSVASLTIPHSTTRDVEFRGYNIPVGTVVFLNMQSLNRDPEVWNNPSIFNPKRFLDESGKLDNKITDKLITFGLGRRKCPGEHLARLEIFLFLTNIIQRCNLELADKNSSENRGEYALLLKPLPFRIKVSPVN